MQAESHPGNIEYRYPPSLRGIIDIIENDPLPPKISSNGNYVDHRIKDFFSIATECTEVELFRYMFEDRYTRKGNYDKPLVLESFSNKYITPFEIELLKEKFNEEYFVFNYGHTFFISQVIALLYLDDIDLRNKICRVMFGPEKNTPEEQAYKLALYCIALHVYLENKALMNQRL